MLVLLFVALWFYSTRRFVLSLALLFCSCSFFSPFSIAITSLEEKGADICVFRTFVRFALVFFSVSSSSSFLGSAAACDYGTPWTFLLAFLHTTPVVFVPCGNTRKFPRIFI